MDEVDKKLGLQEGYQSLKEKTKAEAAKLDEEYHLSERYQQMKLQTREKASKLDSSYKISETWNSMKSSMKVFSNGMTNLRHGSMP